MAEQPSRRPTGPRRGRTSFVQSIIGSVTKVWYGFWYYLSAPMRWFSRRRPTAAEAAAATTGRKLRYYIFLPVSIIGTLIQRAGRGIGWWWRSTSAKFFLQSLPAIIVGLGAVATAVVAYTKPTEKVIDNYKRSGQIAMGEDNFTVARICYSRLVQLQNDNPEALYKLALAEEGVDELNGETTNRAYAIMDQLAPDPKPVVKDGKETIDEENGGLWQAHLWKAEKFLSINPPSQQSLMLAMYHFGQVAKKATNEPEPEKVEEVIEATTSTEANADNESGEESEDEEMDITTRAKPSPLDYLNAMTGLYDIYMKVGQLNQAQRFLQYAHRMPGREELAVVFWRSQLGNPAQQQLARRELEKLRTAYTALLEIDPGNTPVRLALAETHRLLQDYQSAEVVLVEGTRLGLPDEKDLHVSLANLYTIRLQGLGSQIKPDVQLQLVQMILDHDPGNVYMLQRLLALAEDRSNDASKQTQELISKVIASGPRNPIAPTFHLIRADYWLSKGDDEKARIHLNQAFQLNNQLSELANTYAWMVAITPPFDLERALKLINGVLAFGQNMENPKYRDTRGQILTRLGKYKEALEDLEFAVKEMPSSRSVHTTLEICYKNLGMEDKAKEEAETAKRLDGELMAQRMAQADKKLFGIPSVLNTTEPTSVADDERLEIYEKQAKSKKEGEPVDSSLNPPANPNPTEPAPTEPAPTEPAPTEPTPTEPTPTEPSAPAPAENKTPTPETPAAPTGEQPTLPASETSDPLPNP